MYKYYKLNLFLVLIRKFDQSQTFIPDSPELRHIEGPNGKKTWFSRARSGIT